MLQDRSPMPRAVRGAAAGVAMAILLTMVMLLTTAARLVAQPPGPDGRPRQVGSIPRDVRGDAIRLFNASTTRRVRGDFVLAATDTVRGDLAVQGGRVRLAGTVTGHVLVLNGDLRLEDGARVSGNLTVIGGLFEAPSRSTVDGQVRVFSAQLLVRASGDTLEAPADVERLARWSRWEQDASNGADTRLFLTTAHTYNRVEGLPVFLGSRLRVRNGNTGVEAEAFGIVRTQDRLALQRASLGHRVRLEAREGRTSGWLVGGRLFDEVDAVERWQLSETEVGLSTFLFSRDYRDYWGRRGSQGYVGLFGTGETGVRFALSQERWGSRRAMDVPSLFNGNAPWRRNPEMDGGHVQLVTLSGALDTRDSPDDPRHGWLLRAELEQGRGTLDSIAATTPGIRDVRAGAMSYARVFADLRRYTRLSPGLQLNLRAVAGARIGPDPLPLQRRWAVSGIDALPGFPFRRFTGTTDGGTCASGTADAYERLGRPAQCERLVLMQAALTGDFRLRLFGNREPLGARRWLPGLGRADGAWVLFVDSGRGWLPGGPTDALHMQPRAFPGPREWNTDVGAGLDFRVVGVYVAQAVSQSTGQSGGHPTVYLRLGHRF